MPRIARSRVKQLERRMNVDGPAIRRLLFLLPDLWPEPDRAAFEDSNLPLEKLGDLLERRTGVRPTFNSDDFWPMTVPATAEMLAMTGAEKAAFLERHETRPRRPDHWAWRPVADDSREGDARSPSPGGSARSRSGIGRARPTSDPRT